MAATLIIAFILGYKKNVDYCFIHHLQEYFDPITLYGSVYPLPSFHVINKVVYVTIAELAYVIIG